MSTQSHQSPLVEPQQDRASRSPLSETAAPRPQSRASRPLQFTAFSRLLHWTMAAMVLAMVASLADYHTLVSIHRPLGIAILVLVVVRFVNRLWNPPPPFPVTTSRAERLAATASEYTMYGLMITLPLVGWGMLSAAHYPIVLFGSIHLPFILPHDAQFYAILRKA